VNGCDGTVALIRAGANNVYDAPVRIDTGKGACYFDIVTGDLNGDGFIDALVGDRFSNTVSAYFGQADGTFVTGRQINLPSSPLGMDLGDLNGDGFLDLVVAGDNAKRIFIFLGNGRGSFDEGSHLSSNDRPAAVLIADLDGDKIQDIAALHGTTRGVALVFRGAGKARFRTPTELKVSRAINTYPNSIAAGDWDGDGAIDLAITTARDLLVTCLGDGSGRRFRMVRHETRKATSIGTGVIIDDLNNDMRQDIAFATNDRKSGKVRLYIKNTSGFTKQVLNAGSALGQIAVADMDGDGDQDLIVADTGSNNVIVLTNTCVP
jgi:hypothetical protein